MTTTTTTEAAAASTRAPALTLPAFLASHPAAQPPKSVLPALYAELEFQRSSNPHAFASSLDKWQALLVDAAFLGVQLGASGTATSDRTVLHADSTLQANWSIRGLGRPLGLGTVIAELAAQRQLVRLHDFLNSTQPLASPSSSSSAQSPASTVQTLGRVAARLLTAPLWWSLGQLGFAGSESGVDEDDQAGSHSEGSAFWKKKVAGDWVLWRNVDRLAAAVLEAHFASASSPIDHLYSPELLRTVLLPKAQAILTRSTETPPATLSELDVKVLLKHLSRDQKVILTDSGGQVIKFAPSQHAPGAIERIAESDRGILQVRDAHVRLEKQVAEVESRIADRDARIRTALRAQPKQLAQAKSYLTSKKALEDLLKRRLGALETMNAVTLKLEQASGDIEIMKAYDTSTTTLKALLSHPSLNIDKVEDTMAALTDALADSAEVDGVIRAGGEGMVSVSASGEGIDEDELERELAELEREHREGLLSAAAAAAAAAGPTVEEGVAASTTGAAGAGESTSLPAAPAGAIAEPDATSRHAAPIAES
ncbi:hypothetical protein V8E36_005625 [Tilletia maclaganii]